ncbi:MAG: hypothetical protein H7176_07275 [Bdellovibrionales bacterium]|nr:hypothetical protein [Massilia sp.]
MHPFALNEKQVEQVSGGIFKGMIIAPPLTPIYPFPPKDEEYSTDALGEEGGWVPPTVPAV